MCESAIAGKGRDSGWAAARHGVAVPREKREKRNLVSALRRLATKSRDPDSIKGIVSDCVWRLVTWARSGTISPLM